MGWRAITREFEELTEEKHGRPMEAGEQGKLLCIAQEDFGHNVAIDLQRGLVFLDYDELSMQNGTIEVKGPKIIFFICDETSRVGEYFHIDSSEPDEEGNYINTFRPLLWRPIWFTRWTNGVPTKVIGAQTTLPEGFGSKNVKKLISIFADGTMGID